MDRRPQSFSNAAKVCYGIFQNL